MKRKLKVLEQNYTSNDPLKNIQIDSENDSEQPNTNRFSLNKKSNGSKERIQSDDVVEPETY